MYKVKTKWSGIKENALRKHDIVFVLLPTMGYVTSLYNTKVEHNIIFTWLFFGIEIQYRFED